MSRYGGLSAGASSILNDWNNRKSSSLSISAPATVLDLDYSTAKGIWSLNSTVQFPKAPIGQQEYTTPGTYSWTAPAGVTSVNVVVVGGGGGGGQNFGSGGAGGGLAYKNNVSVIPGQSYTVIVGAAGPGLISSVAITTIAGSALTYNGKASSFSNNTIIVAATGGEHGSGISSNTAPLGGSRSGITDGGGTGGASAGNYSAVGGFGGTGFISSGGGGAGGYSGNGGTGAGSLVADGTYIQPTSGAGGAGGGGAGMKTDTGTTNYGGAGGGGVGLLGEGTSGSAGTTDSTAASPDATMAGLGGSNGSNGTIPPNTNAGGAGGLYGGGGGSGAGDAATSVGGAGAGGAVRIIWGLGRAFPSTNTGNL